MKSSQAQLSDRQKGLNVTSPGFNIATRVEMSVSGDSGMVSVAKKEQQRLYLSMNIAVSSIKNID